MNALPRYFGQDFERSARGPTRRLLCSLKLCSSPLCAMSEVQRMLLAKASQAASANPAPSTMHAPPPRPPRGAPVGTPPTAPTCPSSGAPVPPETSSAVGLGDACGDQAVWQPYFDQRRLLSVRVPLGEGQSCGSEDGGGNVFAVYTAGDENLQGPVIVLLHGGWHAIYILFYMVW